MKSRPIMFSTPMIQALPYKSQTRRTRGLEIVNKHPDMWNYLGGKQGIHIFEHKDIEDYRLEIKCPYGVKGDQLWCKETYGWVEHGEESDLIYKADGHFANEQNISKEDRFKWKSAMFMFRWMSRHLLELVEEPIPQRLWDITEADAKAEGVEAIWASPDEETNKALRRIGAKEVTEPYIIGYKNYLYKADKRYHYSNPHGCEFFAGTGAAVKSYASLWDLLNKSHYLWDANPWVWKLKFRES